MALQRRQRSDILWSMLRRPAPGIQRAAVAILLLGGAYLALRPFATCAFSLGEWRLDFAQFCAFGTGSASFDRYGPGPLWPYVVVAGIYVWAAIAVAVAGGRWMAPTMAAAGLTFLALIGGLALLNGTRPAPLATSAPASAVPRVASAAAAPSTAIPMPRVLGSDCAYVDNGAVSGSATTWKILCPQGLASNAVRPAIEAQRWVPCGRNVWSREQLQTAVIDAVNVTGFSGWLDQRPLSGGSCVQPTPPPSGTGVP